MSPYTVPNKNETWRPTYRNVSHLPRICCVVGQFRLKPRPKAFDRLVANIVCSYALHCECVQAPKRERVLLAFNSSV